MCDVDILGFLMVKMRLQLQTKYKKIPVKFSKTNKKKYNFLGILGILSYSVIHLINFQSFEFSLSTYVYVKTENFKFKMENGYIKESSKPLRKQCTVQQH